MSIDLENNFFVQESLIRFYYGLVVHILEISLQSLGESGITSRNPFSRRTCVVRRFLSRMHSKCPEIYGRWLIEYNELFLKVHEV